LKIFTTRAETGQYLSGVRQSGKTIGFVPTMGALHQGHLSLIELARQASDVTVCSIFVNPTQFTDPKDLEKYPRTVEADTALLEKAGCDVLFCPPVSEIYAGDEKSWHIDLGQIEFLLEGKFRPGHYQGVTQVVYKLFSIVEPDLAFFGQKDYQQFLVISKMVGHFALPVKLVMCPIVREPDGLAMSSRNIHLSTDDRRHALVLSKTLLWVKDHFPDKTMEELKSEAERRMASEEDVEPDYFEIADGDTLLPATSNSKTIVALVAAKVGKTRLIDNVILVHGS
jgi:pantoate--beta-alanine ligase